MPFERTSDRYRWERHFRDVLGVDSCAICGESVIWDRKVAPAHGPAGSLSDRAANLDHIISDRAECERMGIVYTSQENLRVSCRKCNYRKNKHGDSAPTRFTYRGPGLPPR